jgi:hypothetical protein
VIPAKKKGTEATVPMVVTGLASPSYAPGAYGVFSPAGATIDRHVHTDPSGKLLSGVACHPSGKNFCTVASGTLNLKSARSSP